MHMRYSANRDIADHVEKLLKEHGWKYVAQGNGKHAKLVAPNGRKTTIPGSPSDWRSFRNFKRDTAYLASLPAAQKSKAKRA